MEDNDRAVRERRKKRKSKGKDRKKGGKRTEKRAKASESGEGGGAASETEDQKEARYQEYIARIKAEYVPLHPQLLDLTKWGFADSFVRLCASPSDNKEHLIEAGSGIYLVEIFTLDFCNLLLAEVDHFEAWCSEKEISILRPNSMNNYGVVLDHIPGFSEVLQQFVQQMVEPLSRLLYPYLHPERSSKPSSMDSHHGFVVEYGAGKDKKLDWHVDDSDVTLNVCLGKEFDGGDLVFSGVRCEAHRRDTPPLASKDENVRVAHLAGHGLLHVGKHRHAALPIKSGERTNFILWCRNSQFEPSAEESGSARSCPSWCGWHRMSQL